MGTSLAAIVWTRPHVDEVEQFAADELQRYLNQMLGQDVGLQSSIQAFDLPSLYLATEAGEFPATVSNLAGILPPDGYVLRSYEEGILLQAPTPRGLLYAVYGLLKRLGARWFFPGPRGEFIPRLRTLSLEGLDVTEKPAVAQRGVLIRGTDGLYKEWIDFAPKIGLNAFALETHHGVHQLPKLAAGRGLRSAPAPPFLPNHLLFPGRAHPALGRDADERLPAIAAGGD